MADGIELAAAYVSLIPSLKGQGRSITDQLGATGTQGGQKAATGFRSRFKRGSDGAASDTESRFSKSFKRMAAGVATVFAAKKGFDLLKGTANSYKSAVADANKLKRYIGGSIEDASRLAFVSQQVGIAPEKFAKTLGLFNKNLTGGKLDGFGASLKASAKNAEKLASAQDKLATARQNLDDLEAVQRSKKSLTVSDEIAHRKALEAVASAQDDVATYSAKASKKVANLGFDTRDANGKLLPTVDILRNIATKFKGMEDGPQKTALAMKIFGRSGADLVPLLNKGADGIDELMKKSDELGLTFGDADVKAMAESNKAQRLWKASLQSLSIQIGRYVLPVMTRFTSFLASKMPPVIRFVAQAAKKVSTAFAPFVSKVGPALQRVASFLTPLVDRIRSFFANDPKARFAALATVVGGVMLSAVWALAGAVLALFSPMLLVVGGLALLVAGVIYAYKRFAGFRKVVDGVAKWMVSTAWPAVQRFGLGIRDLFLKLVGWVRDHWGEIKAGVASVVAWFTGTAWPMLQRFGASVRGLWDSMVAYVRRVWPSIQEAVGHVVVVIRSQIERFVQVVGYLWQTWGGRLLSVAKIAFGFVKSFIGNVLQVVRGIIKTVTALINGDWGKAWDGFKNVLAGVWDAITGIVKLGFGVIQNLFSGLGQMLGAGWSIAWTWVKNEVSRLFGITVAWIGEKVDGVVGFFTGLPDRIKDSVKDLAGAIYEPFRTAFDWIMGKVQDAVTLFTSAKNTLLGKATIDPFDIVSKGLGGVGGPAPKSVWGLPALPGAATSALAITGSPAPGMASTSGAGSSRASRNAGVRDVHFHRAENEGQLLRQTARELRR